MHALLYDKFKFKFRILNALIKTTNSHIKRSERTQIEHSLGQSCNQQKIGDKQNQIQQFIGLDIFEIKLNQFLLYLFYKLIQMTSKYAVLLIAVIIIQASGLHLLENVQQQIDALKQQQKKFEGKFNEVISNINQTQAKLNRTSNVDEKVLILQNAIKSQREKVFNLSTILIPPFNITKEGCQKMSNQQRVDLIQKLNAAKAEVNEFKKLASTMPKCDDVEIIKSDIEKQIFFLNSIQKIIYTNCSANVVLSPTIFQTNIYADGWVLGNMTIDDLIEQYYQRSIRYDNITNCPIDKPFFNGLLCIDCKNQVFDISKKQCTSCPDDFHVDNTKRICVPNTHHTDWPTLQNYSPRFDVYPVPEKGSTPCPKQKPYYNGTACIPCVLPNYFDVNTGVCAPCKTGQKFDINDRACSVLQKQYITDLRSDWVTGPNNFTNVLQQRRKLLQGDTQNVYKLCPSQSPYFDGIKCISCPTGQQFDLNTLKCVTAPKDQAFDPNIHNYLPPGKQSNTNPNDKNLLGTPSNDPKLPTCDSSTPHWDGVACILCPSPFNLFNVNQKKCVSCDPQDYFKDGACIPRPVVWVSTRQDKLLNGPKVTTQQYLNNIKKAAQNPGQAIVGYCKSNQYTNYKQCITCSDNQYFDVQKLQCVTCQNGDVYDAVTKTCKKPEIPGQLFTNFNNGSLILNMTPQQKAQQQKNFQSNPKNTLCDIKTPYKTATGCIACTQKDGKVFFDWNTKTCVGCGSSQYLSKTDAGYQCIQKQLVSNPTVFTEPYIDPTNKVPKMNQQITNLKNLGIGYNNCTAGTPYEKNGTCTSISCGQNQVFDFSQDKCISCPTYDKNTHTCPKPATYYPDLDNGKWISSNPADTTKWRDSLNVNGAVKCTTPGPYYDGTNCVACNGVFNYDTKKCENCPAGQLYNPTTHKCEPCPTGQVFNTNTNKCQPCPADKFYNTATKTCDSCIGNIQNGVCVACPPNTIFKADNTGNKCQACPPNTVYTPGTNGAAAKCEACPTGTVFSNGKCITPQNFKTNFYEAPNLIYGGKSGAQWKQIYDANPNPVCSSPTYYFNGVQCVSCPADKAYWSLQQNICMYCPTGSYYQQSSKTCRDQNGSSVVINPDIAKMFSNIF